ncbi:indolethylamine N-methyltransferase-like [Anomaloglossus baeobatrachus]|uniref:indolethylamine N-methyltransferase-like n=1 Tax=Anomaloglossus baeobatrachus TaxID=238106 RepID=UPI003F508279
MDPCTHKLYHKDDFDSRQCLDHYFSDKSSSVFGEDSLIFPIENLTNTFSKGHINGDVLIDLSVGPLVHHLYAACEFFKHIIVMKASDQCIMELKRWVDERTGAFEWGHAAQLHVDTEGKSHQLEDKEQKVRSALNHVVKCDLEKENMMDPIVLPQADCIISAWLLDVISKDHDDYMRYIRKFSKLLKPGGHIILFGDLDTTFYMIGKDKFHLLNYDEEFARKALETEGFIIDFCNTKKRTVVNDLCDCKALLYIVAHKES